MSDLSNKPAPVEPSPLLNTVDNVVKQWGIRDMPTAGRDAAIAAADLAGMRMGDWLTWAINTAINAGPLAGLSVEARNAALTAAQRTGMEPGEYLSRAIRSAIQAEMAENRQPVAVSSPVLACSIDDATKAMGLAERLAAATGKKIPNRMLAALKRQVMANLGS